MKCPKSFVGSDYKCNMLYRNVIILLVNGTKFRQNVTIAPRPELIAQLFSFFFFLGGQLQCPSYGVIITISS